MPIYLFACIYVDKLKSRLMDNLTGLPSTKMHVDNEKDRLIKNAHIIAEVKARNAEEEDKRGIELYMYICVFVGVCIHM